MQKPTFFAVLMYFLYDHSRYFNFKRKYQQYGPHLQTVFPFLMTMAFSMAYFCFFSASFSVSLPNSAAAFCYFSFLFFFVSWYTAYEQFQYIEDFFSQCVNFLWPLSCPSSILCSLKTHQSIFGHSRPPCPSHIFVIRQTSFDITVNIV